MPDHYHLLIKMIVENALSKYINIIENSYSRYLNKKINRKGPLWQTRFKTVKIKNNEQLLHVSRYIHLNPTTSGLVKKPEDWGASSYHYFINGPFLEKVPEISIRKIDNYKKFTEDQIDYQKKLKIIKRKLLE